MKYEVRYYMDKEYSVYNNESDIHSPVFVGSLSDCEAYIRLKEGGYM